MSTNNKLFCAFGMVLAALGYTTAASAATHVATAPVYSVGIFTNTLAWNDAIQLQGVTSMGTCPTDPSTGFVILRIAKDNDGTNPSANRAYTLVLTAFTLGKSLYVQVDDTVLLNGDCELEAAQMHL